MIRDIRHISPDNNAAFGYLAPYRLTCICFATLRYACEYRVVGTES
jgi:hypothetical protein